MKKLKFTAKNLLRKLIHKFLGKHVHAFVVKCEQGLFMVDPEDATIGQRLRKQGNYATDEINRLQQTMTSESKVLIVGAHIGALAIPLSKHCKNIVAIEANPRSFELLEANIKLNNITNCTPINIAASHQHETIEFLLNRENSGGSKRVPKVKKASYYYDNPEAISIKAAPLDEYLEEKYFDIVVMDIEGSEYFALQGMQTILQNARLLAIEFLPHHLIFVSGVSVEQFLSVITPNFDRLTIPSIKLQVHSNDFLSALTDMFNQDQGDDGIIFEKTR